MDATTQGKMNTKLGSKRKGSYNKETDIKTKIPRTFVQHRYFLRSKTRNEKFNEGDISVKILTSNDNETLRSDFSYSPSTCYGETATSISNDKADSDAKGGPIKKTEEHEHVGERDGSIVSSVEDTEKGNEREFQTITTDDENSEQNLDVSIPVVGEERAKEQTPDEYVYRILRFDETYHNGLRPKNIFSRISLEQHVERGSKGQESRFISCCKSLSGIHRLGRLTNEYQRTREVVKINISKLNNRAQVIDLTKEEIRERHIARSSRAWGYAENFEEVIIDPISYVPPECVEKIGVVHMRSFSGI